MMKTIDPESFDTEAMESALKIIFENSWPAS
jgi:hypothetical protein